MDNVQFEVYEPKFSFSTLADRLTITLDNSKNDYDKFIPAGFILSRDIETIDFHNGLKVSRRWEDDENGLQHILYDFFIDRTVKPTAINYV